MLLQLIERRKGSINMSDFNKIISEARRAADEIKEKINSTTAAINAAAAEMEQAALAGNDKAYAKAKDRLEIIRIQEQKQAEMNDPREQALSVMRKAQTECLEEMRKISGVFLSQYDDLLRTVAIVTDYKNQYDQLRDYMRDYVLKTTNFPFLTMEEIFPVNQMTDIERKNRYSMGLVKDAVNKH